MKIDAILACLSGEHDWAVVFDLHQVLSVADPLVIRDMFCLPKGYPLEGVGQVILTPTGSLTAPQRDGPLVAVDGSEVSAPEPGAASLAERYRGLLDRLDCQHAICIGLGRQEPFPPVALVVSGTGEALIGTAVFESFPSMRHFELLGACGVRPLGVEQVGEKVVARFGNALPEHLINGLLAGFSRTAHCNLFFLRHGDIDATLERGLIEAGRARVEAGRRLTVAILMKMAKLARTETLAMTCRPPPPEAPHPYGDLVPLGFLARALAAVPRREARAAAELLRRHLRGRARDGLWAFHTDLLVTATDSALVLLGLNDRAAVRALERFADGAGGYLPQLASDTQRPDHMRRSPATRHWCQAEYATTCLVRALRRAQGLEARTPLSWIATRFEQRAGLYFANPYLTDWATALALEGESGEEASRLRDRLGAEVAASMNADHSFGGYDRALSTALAILTLAATGRRGRLVRCAQVRLLELVDDSGQRPAATPFFSTLALGGEALRVPGLIRAGRDWHALTLYEDSHALIGTALAALALGAPCDPRIGDMPDPDERPHPRYRAQGVADYVARHALPPYLGDLP
ncbi:hypothetical protein Thiowin_01458 [Thiorhodovibrio winogradskyi]|uniref:Uncharacterized protein n=1 Tax=Thiorhodovibrio winogradskyi TaxID=77007 RepID=A0ABZ0S6D5_9GAMM|nr:hypothetical protein [Thiorhodovibrio winogradskyi]